MSFDVSVILLFQNHEETIGTVVESAVRLLREHHMSFELIATDVASRDNSAAVLSLVRTRYPELRVTTPPSVRRTHEHSASLARGRIVWFTTPDAAVPSLESFIRAYHRIIHRDCDLIQLDAHSIVARREHLMHLVRRARSHGRRIPRHVVSRAHRLGLTVVGSPVSTWFPHRRLHRWVEPIVIAFSSARLTREQI